jgi:cell division protein FtsW (lipid II flippase)
MSGQNRPVDLARIAWLVTALLCLIAVLILVLQRDFGYAAVTFAVAVSAAINLR